MRWPSARALRFVALAMGLALPQAVMAQDIKVGFNGDLSSSPSATVGQMAVVGLQAAIEDINAAGGLLGKKLSLIVRDDVSVPPKSIQNMSDLIDNEKVVAIFGPSNSGNALAWRHIPNQKKIPVIVPLATATDITKPMSPGAENYMFRISMVDRDQASKLVAYVKNHPTAKKVAYMAETTGYGQAALKDVEAIGELNGIKPVAIEKFGVNDTDMTPQLNKMRSAGADIILILAQGSPIAYVLRSMEKINYQAPVVTLWGPQTRSFYEIAGPKLSEIPIFLATGAVKFSPKQQALYDRLLPKMVATSLFYVVQTSYDAMMIFAMAAKQAGSTEGPKLRAALEDLNTPYDGYLKSYNKPFSATKREALVAADYLWTSWREGKLAPYADDVTRKLRPEDYK